MNRPISFRSSRSGENRPTLSEAVETSFNAPTSRSTRSPWLIDPLLMSRRAATSAKLIGNGEAKTIP